VVNRPFVPIVRHVQEGTNLTHDEIITLKQVGFISSKVVKSLCINIWIHMLGPKLETTKLSNALLHSSSPRGVGKLK
jgi:hypothetical protein